MSDIALPSRSSRLALPLLVAGGIAIGASPIFVRLSELGPSATAFHRMLWALPLLYLWMRLERRHGLHPRRAPTAGERARLLLAGLLFVGDLVFWHWSILYTTVANATLFANFSPVIVAIGAFVFLGERITARLLVGMALSLAGAALLVGGSFELGGRYVLGDMLGLVTAVFFGSYMVAIAGLRSVLPAARVMFWSSLVTCLGLLPVALIAGESIMPESASGFLVLLGLAWLSQAAGQGLIGYALGHLPASFSALVILIEPLTAAVLGWALLAEALGPLQGFGAAVVLAGIVVARRSGADPA